MFFILSKLLDVFLFPSNAIGFLALAGLVLAVLGFRRAGGYALGLAAVGLLALGWLPIGSAALLVLENRFPQPQIGSKVTGIVVLGGEIDTHISAERNRIVLTDAAERLTKTAELSRRYPDARIILSGGLSDRGRTESALARDLLVSIGVPAERIEIEERSRNTCENATQSKAVARPAPGDVWLLVTSAFHMPRAVACFRAAGFPIVPYPVDYYVSPPDLRRLMPTITAGLDNADGAAHEWLGLLAYHLAKGTELFPAPEVR